MAAESDQPQEDLERSTEAVVTYGPEAVGRVRKVTTWVAGKAIDGTAKAVEYTGKAIQYAGKGVQFTGTGISAAGTGIASSLGAIPFVGIPFRVLGMGINGAGKGVQFAGKGIEVLGKGVESAGKGLGKLKQGFNNLGGLLKSGKNIAQLSKLAGGPVGWAMLATKFIPYFDKIKNFAKKAALVAGGYLFYLLLKFLAPIIKIIVFIAKYLVPVVKFLAPIVAPVAKLFAPVAKFIYATQIAPVLKILAPVAKLFAPLVVPVAKFFAPAIVPAAKIFYATQIAPTVKTLTLAAKVGAPVAKAAAPYVAPAAKVIYATQIAPWVEILGPVGKFLAPVGKFFTTKIVIPQIESYALQAKFFATKVLPTTIHFATHPWEIITKPLAQGWSWGKGAFNTVTGGPIEVGGGIPGAISGGVSAVGSAVSSVAATIWNGAVGAVGAGFGGLASGLNFVVGGLTSVGLPASAAMIPVVGGVGAIAVGGTLVGIVTATSFFSPQQDFVIGGTGDNEIYTITKTASDGHFDIDEIPQELTYTIKLTAKTELSNISVTDKIEVRRKDGISFTINKDTEDKLINPPCGGIQTLASGSDWTCQFKIGVDSLTYFKNSVITNTVTITAGKLGSAPVTDTAFSVTTVGSPPVGCPNGWPTKQGSITQGSQGPASHAKLYLPGLDGLPESAIDIGGATTHGTPAYATFAGQVTNAVNSASDEGYGTYVDIAATCNGTYFVARWAHLKYNSIDSAITLGSTITFGQFIGEVDNTGWSEGDHLHYSLFFLDIETYIPEVPQDLNCQVGTSIPCNVSWP